MVAPLCTGHFPLNASFEELEQQQQHNKNVVFVDFAAKRPLKSKALSALRYFLRDEQGFGKIVCQRNFEGFSFVEAAYTVFRCSRVERQLVKMDILSSFLSMLIHSAKEAVKYAQACDPNIENIEIAQNNVRLCTFFLGHSLCIIEDMQVHAPGKERKTIAPKYETFNDAEYLELKSSTLSLFCNILKISKQAVGSPNVKAAGEIIRNAAVSCLIHQKWGDRGTLARATLEVLKKAILGILSDSFSSDPSLASEVPQETFSSLMSLCVKHKHLIPFMADFMEHLMTRDELAGISFMAQVVKKATEKDADAEKTSCLQDEIESAMSLLADFATRHDALVLVSLHLGSLLMTLRNERAAIRKCFSVISGCCLKKFDVLSPADQHTLEQIHDVLSRDRDATCRLRALTNLGNDLKWVQYSDDRTISLFISVISKRVPDKSKIVRLKAIQILEAIFSFKTLTRSSTPNSPPHSIIAGAPAMFVKFSKFLAVSSDSSYFCKDTLEALGHLLCCPILKGPIMFELLDSLLNFSFSSSNLPVIFDIFNFYLDGCEMWMNFLINRDETSIMKLQNLLTMAADRIKSEISNYQKIVEKTFDALENHRALNLGNAVVRASCAVIAILASIGCFTLSDVEKKGRCLIEILAECVKQETNVDLTAEAVIRKQIINWAFKILAMLLKTGNKIIEKEVKRFIESNFLYLLENRIDGYLDCLYCLSNPFEVVKKILCIYEDQYQVLDTKQPLKVLYMYITFLGDISRTYDKACDSFIKCLRNVEMDLSKPITFGNTSSQFDYLQQEELRAMEEDAIARFAQMLLDGDSVPGCYVPFLRALVHGENLPTVLRVAATRSLGQYMLASCHLAKDHKDVLEFLFHSEIPELKITALSLAEKLIITFPNDFLFAVNFIESCLKDETVKEMAYRAYAHLLLVDKFKPDLLLTPICDGLCEANENVRTIVIFLLKKLLKDSGRSKIKSVLHLYNNTAKVESRQRLVEVLVMELLDNEDLQSDELATSILHLLAKGRNDAAFFASFLHPSPKVLNIMLSYLKSSPPKIYIQGDNEAEKYLIKFVSNYKRLEATSSVKDLVASLLDLLESKPRRKRKGPVENTDVEVASKMSLEEYEKAIESFKNCQVTSSLRDIVRMDI
ncbi:hypothetical protein SUGI_0756000 [Cryptomeria japonica]|uniref:uncharacterized protein LOC131029644 n=1 Tax=Cryptomeria japonica TaxID=3369 RepID=UPI0024147F99|nr:uncharacterized protein LOC131029644 [Cryptomeria japonica]GLJ37267.1 hypothetical protein SUGI_0756000 [Cryptomeria japonica]